MIKGDLVQEMEQLLADRVPFVTATVVRAAKPTSVRPGDAAIVLSDGTIDGFVGGVCAQASVRLHAALVKSPKSAAEAAKKYGAKGAPRLVLFSPIAVENLKDPNLPDGVALNKNIKLYAG